MNKKRIYPVQIALSHSSPCFLPYSMGCISAYLKNDPEIMQAYEVCNIVSIRETVPEILKRFDNPDIVAFTNFVWNLEYNKELAKELKKLYPEVIIIFGGHSVPPDASFLEKYGFIDYLMHNEGEETFTLLLKALENGNDLSSVPNLSYRSENGCVTTEEYHPTDISSYPSPYTEGVFDCLLNEFPNVEFHATLETNRGCPYMCAYCEWCFTRRIREFPMEKIKAEIDWIAKNKIRYCYCADANFGISARDIEIAQYVVDCNKNNGYPQIFKPCYAKNSDENIFEIGKLLNKNGVDKGVTLAYQSMSPTVLENIGRKNLDINYYSRLNALYSAEGIPTYTELILGLPGETYESFCNGLCGLLEAGQHNSITVYTCQVYCNSPLAQPDYKEKHGIRWERVPLHGIHYPANFNGVQEYYDIVVETKDMSKEEWVKANMFSVCLQSFHHLGLLRCFAIYSRFEKGISYFDFYNRLLNYIFSDETKYIYKLFNMIKSKTEDTRNSDWCYQNDIFSKVGWYFEEGAFLDMAYNSNIFWQEIGGFIDSLGIEEKVKTALFEYQKSIIRLPDQETPIIESDYDFYNYFENIYKMEYAPLKKQKNRWCSLRASNACSLRKHC